MRTRKKHFFAIILLGVMLFMNVYGCQSPAPTVSSAGSEHTRQLQNECPTPIPLQAPLPIMPTPVSTMIFHPTPEWVSLSSSDSMPFEFTFPDLIFLIDESFSMKGSGGEEYRIPFFFLNVIQKLNNKKAGNDINVSVLYLDDQLSQNIIQNKDFEGLQPLSSFDLSGLEKKIETPLSKYSVFQEHNQLINWFIKNPPKRRTMLIWLTDGTIDMRKGVTMNSDFDVLANTLEGLTKGSSNLEMFVFLVKTEVVPTPSFLFFWRGIDSIPGVHVQKLDSPPQVNTLKYFFQVLNTPLSGDVDLPHAQDLYTPSFTGWRIFESKGTDCGDGSTLTPYPPNLYTGDNPSPLTLFISYNEPKITDPVNLDLASKKNRLCSADNFIENKVQELCENDGIYFYWWRTYGFAMKTNPPEMKENKLVCNNSNTNEENVIHLHADVEIPEYGDWVDEEWQYLKKCVYPILSLESSGMNRWLGQESLSSSQLEFTIEEPFVNVPESLTASYSINLRGTDCDKSEKGCFQDQLTLRYYPVFNFASVDGNTVTFEFSFLDDGYYTSNVVKDNDHLQWPLIKFSHQDMEGKNQDEGNEHDRTPENSSPSTVCGLGTEFVFDDARANGSQTVRHGMILVEENNALKVSYSDQERIGCNVIELYWEDKSWTEECGVDKLKPLRFLVKWKQDSGVKGNEQAWVLDEVELLNDE